MTRAMIQLRLAIMAILLFARSVAADERDNIADPQSLDRLTCLIESPSVTGLKELLPEELRTEVVRLLQQQSPVTQKPAGPVWEFPLPKQKVFVVLAELQARNPGTGQPQDDLRGPQAGFLFNSSGTLVKQFGGTYSPKGSPDSVDIINLGPEEDWFVRVSGFVDRAPFNYRLEWYRIAVEPVQSLRIYSHPNGNPWTFGPKPIIRYGTLIFNNRGGGQIPLAVAGTTPDRQAMPRSIYWDGDRDRFAGAVREDCEGKPLFEVDTSWSKDFEALSPKPDQLLILGGVREYDHWHAWEILIPERTEARLTLRLPEAAGSPAQAKTSVLKSGLHFLQLQVKPNAETSEIALELRVDEEGPERFRLPGKLSDRQPEAPGIVRIVDRGIRPQLTQAAVEGLDSPITLTIWRP